MFIYPTRRDELQAVPKAVTQISYIQWLRELYSGTQYRCWK